MTTNRLHYFLPLAFGLLMQALGGPIAFAQAPSRETYSLGLRARTLLTALSVEDLILFSERKASLSEAPVTVVDLGSDFEKLETEVLAAAALGAFEKESKLKLAKAARELYQEVRGKGRTYGATGILIYIVGWVMGNPLPVFLYAVGQPGVASVFAVAPFATTALASMIAVNFLTTRSKNIEYYGDLETFRKFRNLRRKVKKETSTQASGNLLLPFSEGDETRVLRVSDSTLGLRLLMKLRFLKPKLHLRAAVSIAKAEGVSLEALEKITELGRLSDSEKLALLLSYFEAKSRDSLDAGLPEQRALARIGEEYADRFLPKDQLPKNTTHDLPEGVLEWVSQALEVKDCRSFDALLEQIPTETLTPRQVEILWNGLVFPELVQSYPGLKLKMFRKIRKETRSIWVAAEKVLLEKWNPEWTVGLRASLKKNCR
jgi:hypothetical protein